MLIWIWHSVGLDCIFKCSSQPALPTELPLKSSQVGQDAVVHSIAYLGKKKSLKKKKAGVSLHQLILSESTGKGERLPVHPVSH